MCNRHGSVVLLFRNTTIELIPDISRYKSNLSHQSLVDYKGRMNVVRRNPASSARLSVVPWHSCKISPKVFDGNIYIESDTG